VIEARAGGDGEVAQGEGVVEIDADPVRCPVQEVLGNLRRGHVRLGVVIVEAQHHPLQIVEPGEAQAAAHRRFLGVAQLQKGIVQEADLDLLLVHLRLEGAVETEVVGDGILQPQRGEQLVTGLIGLEGGQGELATVAVTVEGGRHQRAAPGQLVAQLAVDVALVDAVVDEQAVRAQVATA